MRLGIPRITVSDCHLEVDSGLVLRLSLFGSAVYMLVIDILGAAVALCTLLGYFLTLGAQSSADTRILLAENQIFTLKHLFSYCFRCREFQEKNTPLIKRGLE